MNQRDMERALEKEVEEWPGVTVDFTGGGKHPRAKFTFNGNMLFRPYAGTPGDSYFGVHSMLGDMRRIMRQLGATRTKPEPSAEEDEAPYRKPNDGADKRQDPPRQKAEPEQSLRAKASAAGLEVPSLPWTEGADEEDKPLVWLKLDMETGEFVEGEGWISEPGVYRMDEDLYHSDPCVSPSCSASLLKKALPGGNRGGSPRHMQFAHPRLSPVKAEASPKKFDMGSVFHTLVLGEGAVIDVINSDSWRTKASQEERADSLNAGRQPVLKEQYERALAMLKSAQYQIPIWRDLEEAMADGMPELVLIWQEETAHGSIMCRCRIDWTPARGKAFPDWKTTDASAGPDDYGKVMFDTGADVQDAFYRRGIKAVLRRDAYMIFPAIETYEPHCMMVHQIDRMEVSVANRKVEWGMNVFALCMARGVWPGYPGDIAYQSSPPWVSKKWEDREDSGLTDPTYTERLIEMMVDIPRTGQTFDPEFAADFNLASSGD